MTFQHGLGGYSNHHCRCDVCRSANTVAHREYVRLHADELRAKRRVYFKQWYAANREAHKARVRASDRRRHLPDVIARMRARLAALEAELAAIEAAR